MHILQVCPRIPAPPADGGAVYVYEIGRHLAGQGHDVSVVSLESNRHQQDPDLVRTYGSLYYRDGKFTDYGIISAMRSIVTRQPVSVQHRMNRQVMAKLIKEVKSTPDVILLEGIHTGWFLDQVKHRWAGIPVIMRESNVEYQLLERNAANTANPFISWFYRRQAGYMKKFETRVLQQVDAATAISPVDLRELQKLAPETPMTTIEAGGPLVDSTQNSRDSRCMIAISNWRWKPNFDGLQWFLKQVWPNLTGEFPELKFHVIGEGLSDAFKNRYQAENIVFEGFVEDLTPFLTKAGFQVAPLFSGSGMKLKVLNALSHGLPIVTTSIGSEGIRMKSGEHYMHAESGAEFLSTIRTLLNEPEVSERIACNGRELIKEYYNWETQAGRLSRFLDEIVQKYKANKGTEH